MVSVAVPALEVNAYVEAYEAAQLRCGAADIADFLPASDHPLYREVLRELVRVDLEYGWQRGTPPRLEDYRRRFPQLFADPAAVADIAYEDYRQRLLAGRQPDRDDYERRYGIASAGWPTSLNGEAHDAAVLPPVEEDATSWADPPDVPAGLPRPRDFGLTDLDSVGPPDPTIKLGLYALELYREVRRTDPGAAYRLAHALAAMPEAGGNFLGFHLVEELGRGAFGRVFLARQGDLADRLVALKISTDLFEESQALAQLQHTHIVPIYSVHQAGPFQAVCMPYLGSTTLATVCKGLQNRPSLPDSGKHFVSTIQDRRSTVRFDETIRTDTGGSSLAPRTVVRQAPAEPPRVGKFTAALETLERLTYVQAVVWLGGRLAAGLAHAHERGIFHRDLKPANVLLTDDGQPMLLDFNLSEDVKLRATAAAARVGGTLPYMAPEQLEAFRNKTPPPADGRSDLYALGVLLYELLSGRHPFEVPAGPVADVLPGLIAARRGPPPRLRCWNKAVSPAVEAIVRRCLECDPARRYATARVLQEDLDRHLAELPLRHTPEPSWFERAQKWRRRHPRLTSATVVAAAALVLLAALGAVTAGLWRQQQAFRAAAALQSFRDAKADADLQLSDRDINQLHLQHGLEQARLALDRYRVLDDSNWTERREFRYLPSQEQKQLREEVADLLWAMARATAQQVDSRTDLGPERDQRLAYALELNGRAQETLGDKSSAKSLLWQRAELTELVGRNHEAKQLFEDADKVTARTARDYYQLALKLKDRGSKKSADIQLRESIRLLEESTRRDSHDFRAWFLLGNCHDLLRHDAEAVTCYTACTALNPRSYQSYFKLGLMYARQRRWQKATEAFDVAIALRPESPEAYFERGLAHKELKEYQEAEKDFGRALDLGTEETRVYFRRAEVREKLGNRVGANEDRAEGMKLQPKDEASWNDRGLARMAADPRAALADFEQALRLNRHYLPAWQNKAHVYSDLLHDNPKALEAVGQALAISPDFLQARIGRGVLLARLGKRELAIGDARAALALDATPPTLYQAANIFALTSKQEPLDKREALPLLSRALLGGFGLDVIDKDSDMDPIRSDAEFRRIVEAARKLRGSADRAKTPAAERD